MVTTNIIDVEGIGEHYAKILVDTGITTTDDFLKACHTTQDREALAEKTDISTKMILEWANRCDLMRINGVGEEYSDLLEASGVDTVVELAQRNSENLYDALKAKADETGTRIVRRPPGKDEVASWVDEAKTLPRMLEY